MEEGNKTYYQVGRHVYCVTFCDERNTTALLPSCEPFRLTDVPKDEPLLFELKVDDAWRPERKGKDEEEQENDPEMLHSVQVKERLTDKTNIVFSSEYD